MLQKHLDQVTDMHSYMQWKYQYLLEFNTI